MIVSVLKIALPAMLICNTTIGQEKRQSPRLDTMSGTFLYEKDYKLTIANDAILRAPCIVLNPSINKLKRVYRKGLFLFGDSLTLSKYRKIVHDLNYQIMKSQQFQDLLNQEINAGTKNTVVENYEYYTLNLKIIFGYLGVRPVDVMWKRNKMRRKKLPVFYITEVL